MLSSSWLQFLFPYLPRCPVALGLGVRVWGRATQRVGARLLELKGGATRGVGPESTHKSPCLGFICRAVYLSPQGAQATGKDTSGYLYTQTHTPNPTPSQHVLTHLSGFLLFGTWASHKRKKAQAFPLPSAVTTVMVTGAGKRGPPVCHLKEPLGSLLSVHCSLDKDFLNCPSA